MIVFISILMIFSDSVAFLCFSNNDTILHRKWVLIVYLEKLSSWLLSEDNPTSCFRWQCRIDWVAMEVVVPKQQQILTYEYFTNSW